jgi:hypothetical protein
VLSTGPKGHRFKTSRDDAFLMAIKICSTLSFGWEVKLDSPYHNFYDMLKNLA